MSMNINSYVLMPYIMGGGGVLNMEEAEASMVFFLFFQFLFVILFVILFSK